MRAKLSVKTIAENKAKQRAYQKARYEAQKPIRLLAKEILREIKWFEAEQKREAAFRAWWDENKERILTNQELYRQQADEFFAQAGCRPTPQADPLPPKVEPRCKRAVRRRSLVR